MLSKKFVPCIYLYRGNCVKSLSDVTVTDTDPVRLAKYYADNHADELLLFDMSETDEEHDAALDIFKEICDCVTVDVIGAGHVKRLEDVKKILYTGCKKAVLDYTKPSNVEMTKEASQRFGKDKIMCSYQDAEVLTANRELLQDYVGSLLLMNPHQIRESQEAISLPLYVQVNQVALNKLLDIFSYERVNGVTGNAMNDNIRETLTLKKLCEEKGLVVGAFSAAIPWEKLKKNSDGLIPVVVQDEKTDQVLMLAYMNENAYQTTLQTGKMNYYSRSRKEQWLKGETSGHIQYVRSLSADCDLDTILAKVTQVGVACHTGAMSCFFNEIAKSDKAPSTNPQKVIDQVMEVILDRKKNPKEGSYTNYLFDKGVDKILKKLGEEATEIVIAAKNPNGNEVKYEICDFLYHMMVLMAQQNISWEEITEELSKR